MNEIKSLDLSENFIFKDGVSYSLKFDDIYFSAYDPVGESRVVFANSLDEIWDKKDEFIVAESGFGLGLNFFTLVDKFKFSSKKLHFVSFEKFPISSENLRQIYANLGVYRDELVNFIPKYEKIYTENGLHRVKYDKLITLDLFIGDVNGALKEFDFKADAWFMDGFAPSKNPDMWSESSIKSIANLLKKGAVLATYSASSKLKKELEKANFSVSLLKGHAKKHQMIRAEFLGNNENPNEIYFARPQKTYNPKDSSVLIIGAGIAGIATALAFKNAGFKVKICEKEKSVATNGSGNLCGALLPLITKKGVNLGLMHQRAFEMAREFYSKYAPLNLARVCGSREFAFDEKLQNRYKNSPYPYDELSRPYLSVLIDGAMAIKPKKLCEYFAKDLEILFDYEFVNFKKNGEIYELEFSSGEILQSSIIVFCMGSHTEELFGGGLNPKMSFDEYMQISSVRGQVSWLENALDNEKILSAKGYVCPQVDGINVIGATYGRKDYEIKARDSDDLANIKSVSEFLVSKPKLVGSKVGFRSYSGDRFPLIGPLYDDEFYKQNYKSLHFGKTSFVYPSYKDGVFINAAHGARGLGSAILGANLVLDYALNRPFCIEKSLVNELHPARFLIRKLKKGLVK
ncbi:MAG: bifunctional tRNA (5-methylaminomethyl-2-thiouridine)(34)-methyltransferase MnmD/FAD-dependent 5-carboxymethylaminomethyl-2-thiouridine(34) oxidoreductase MnmC [Campylobacter sp.]|nr:bifunctional tRNA (5-methylaminomethyl-2-thiouridine)(34)-methyltransferase MnmD/FAD-dependent 5-carboxymethylaminomethyl-2-thiouridine(34) oxidoreductase MnmC [Campylobacter sp.]